MGLLRTADQQGKLPREEWRRLSSRAIAPRDGQAGTVHPCHVLAGEKCVKYLQLPIGMYSIVCFYNIPELITLPGICLESHAETGFSKPPKLYESEGVQDFSLNLNPGQSQKFGTDRQTDKRQTYKQY